jgi:hypothetical protein
MAKLFHGARIVSAAQTRPAVVLTVLAALLIIFAIPAHADVGGSYGPAGNSYPGICSVAGTNILTSSSPDKHNVAGANSCETDKLVFSQLIHYDAAGRVINSCNLHIATYGVNYHQCSLQKTTGTGDYWAWHVGFLDNQTNVIPGTEIGCQNDASHYNTCFNGSR